MSMIVRVFGQRLLHEHDRSPHTIYDSVVNDVTCKDTL